MKYALDKWTACMPTMYSQAPLLSLRAMKAGYAAQAGRRVEATRMYIQIDARGIAHFCVYDCSALASYAPPFRFLGGVRISSDTRHTPSVHVLMIDKK